MKQSKLLKKSLAALLAILMVAAMIPMSAFAEDAPAPAEAPFILRVDGKDAAWAEGGFSAKVESNGTSFTLATGDNAQGVTLKEKTTGNTINNAGITVALSEASERPETVGADGAYKYTIQVTAGETVTDYPLTINYTWKAQSSDASIGEVNTDLIAGVAGKATIAGNTITIPMALNHGLTGVKSLSYANGTFKAADAGDADGDSRIVLDAAKSAQLESFTSSSWGSAAVATEASNGMLKKIFVPTDSAAALELDSKILTVKAVDGSTRKYTINFVNETYFTSFAINGVEGKIEGTTITVKMPYGTNLTGAVATWTEANSSVKVFEGEDNTTTIGKNSGDTVTFVTPEPPAVNGKVTVPLKDANKLWVNTKASSTTKTGITVQVVKPASNPSADLTAIQLGAKGQRVEIPAGVTTVNVVLPYEDTTTPSTTVSGVKLWGAAGAAFTLTSQEGTPSGTISSTGDAMIEEPAPVTPPSSGGGDNPGGDGSDGDNTGGGSNGGTDSGTTGGGTGDSSQTSPTAVVVSAGADSPTPTLVDFKNGYFLVKVESQDKKTTKQYRFNVKHATAAARAAELKSFKLVGKDTNGKDIELVGTIGTDKVVSVEIPFAIAKETSQATLKALVVEAVATDGVSISHTANTDFVSGVTKVSDINPSVDMDGLDVGAADANTAKIITWTDAANVSSATLKNTYTVKFIVGAAKLGNKLTAATFTDASELKDVTAENTYVGTFDGNTIKVKIPYSKSSKGGDTISSIRFVNWTLDEGATIVKPDGTSSTKLATKTFATAPSEKTLSDDVAVVSGANWDWEDTTKPLKLRVYNEKDWTAAKNADIDYDASSATYPYTEYTIIAEAEKAETGHELTNITSDVDTNVKVVFDAAHKSAKITVPYSYSKIFASAPKFSLNFVTSTNAKIKMGHAEPITSVVVSDNGSKDTAGRTMFYVNATGELVPCTVSGSDLADGTAVTSSKVGKIDIWDEAETASSRYSFTVAVAEAEKDATLESIKVGEVSATANAEDASKWALVLPYETLLTQKVDIQGVSKVASIQVNGTAYDPDKEYDLSKPLTIKITAEDGVAVETYTLTTTLGEPSTEADITAAKVGEVEATIAGETITAVVAEDFDFTQAVAVSFEVSEGAKVTKLGEAAPTETYTFTDGEAVAVEVTAQDGKTTKTYQLVVTTKKPSSENTITELTVDGIAATIAEEAITAEAENPASVTLGIKVSEGATVTVNGKEYTAGDSIDATEPVTIVVTAEDGTEKTYTLTVTKKAEQPKPGLDDVNDVPADHWAAEAIADILSRGIMTPNSKGNFRPNETVSRGMFAVMMCQLYGVNPEDYADAENPYTDIKKGDWFYNAALAAVANDWMTGTSSTTFSPKEPVTREQTALIIAKAQGLSKVEAPAELYSDDAKIADWAKGWVYACKDADLISYMSASQKTFNPKGDLTRAQIATILTKIHPDTEKPDEPENPDEGNNPENPDEGNNPENPDEGNTPENPDEGNNPENPDEGNTPENPDEGNNPENPDEGNTPENPDEGNTPETPDEGETPAE